MVVEHLQKHLVVLQEIVSPVRDVDMEMPEQHDQNQLSHPTRRQMRRCSSAMKKLPESSGSARLKSRAKSTAPKAKIACSKCCIPSNAEEQGNRPLDTGLRSG